MTEIKSVILDLGGVVIDIDPMQTIEYLRQQGAGNVEEVFAFMEEEGYFDELERGQLTGGQLIKMLNDRFTTKLTPEAILTAWDKLLLGIPKERVETIKALRAKYRLLLLSNTNWPHISTINKMVQKEFGVKDLGVWFDKTYYSYELGLRKPESRIYFHILKDQRLKAQHTIFLDDTLSHLEAAKNLGIQTRLVTPTQGLVEIAQRELL